MEIATKKSFVKAYFRSLWQFVVVTLVVEFIILRIVNVPLSSLSTAYYEEACKNVPRELCDPIAYPYAIIFSLITILLTIAVFIALYFMIVVRKTKEANSISRIRRILFHLAPFIMTLVLILILLFLTA